MLMYCHVPVYMCWCCCRVIGFEPVPHFRAFFEYSVYYNDLQGLVTIHNEVVRMHRGWAGLDWAASR